MLEENDRDEKMFDLAGMSEEPDPLRIQSVRRRMSDLARQPRPRRNRARTLIVTGVMTAGLAVGGLATTRTGRGYLVNLLTPIETTQTITYQVPNSMQTYTRATPGTGGTVSPKAQKVVQAEFQEIHNLAENGGGRLIGLLEGPWGAEPYNVIYQVEYTLSKGTTQTVGVGGLNEKQAKNMKLDEILRLRDSGAGQIIAQQDFLIGLGRYTIRFTLSDGKTVDLTTNYPPGTRAEREAIFAETRALKKELRFSVLSAQRTTIGNTSLVSGILRYRLADGRTVGMTDQIPDEVISKDGKNVTNPQTYEMTNINQ